MHPIGLRRGRQESNMKSHAGPLWPSMSGILHGYCYCCCYCCCYGAQMLIDRRTTQYWSVAAQAISTSRFMTGALSGAAQSLLAKGRTGCEYCC